MLFATGRAPRTDDIGLETVGLEPGLTGCPSTTACRVDRAATGSTRSGTSTTARCSPTRASTRPGSRAPPSPPAPPANPLLDDRPLGRARRHRRPRRPSRRSSSPTRRSPPSASPSPRRSGPATGSARSTTTSPRSRAPACTPTATAAAPACSSTWTARSVLGVTFVGPGVGGTAALRHHRGRRRGPDRPAVARGAGLPDDQRGLAAAAGDVPGLNQAARPAAGQGAGSPAPVRRWPGSGRSSGRPSPGSEERERGSAWSR